jgi:hypothetical protein
MEGVRGSSPLISTKIFLGSQSTPRTKTNVSQTLPGSVSDQTEYAVLYVQASDNFEAIDCANEWALDHGRVRARELTLTRARQDGRGFFVARCNRLAPGEK